MNELQQLTVIPDGTLEQAQAMGLHYEILSAAQAAAESLLALGRKLKKMRDSGGYRHLGFDSFEQYTESAVGIRQRQAYNYISIVEKVPAQLVEENAAAGVTKLALLAKLGPADQREVAPELAQITVKELQALIAEKEGLAQQLSLLQAEPATVVSEASEVDLDAIRAKAAAEAREQARQEADSARIIAVDAARRAAKEEAQKEMEAEIKKIKEEAALDRKEQEDANAAALRYKAECDRRAQEQERLEGLLKSEKEKHQKALKKEKEKAMESARKEAEEKIRQAADEARKAQEKEDAAKLNKARQDAAQAEKAMAELRMQTDPDSSRFMMLFEQLQAKSADLMALSDKMSAGGQEAQAQKLRRAMAGALRAMAEQAEKGGEDHG